MRWYTTEQIPVAFGFSYMFSRLYKTICTYWAPIMGETYGVYSHYLLCLGLCVYGIFSSFVVMYLDKQICDEEEEAKQNESKKDSSILDSFRGLPLNFWLLYICAFTGCLSIYGFLSNQSKFYQLHYGFSKIDAGSIISMNAITCTIGSPIIGVLLANSKRHLFWLKMCGLSLCLSHLYFAFGPNPERSMMSHVPNICIALACVTMVIIVPLQVKTFVPKDKLSKAMVVFKMHEKSGFIFNPTVIGLIIDNTTWNHGFFGVSLLLSMYGFVMICCVFFIENQDNNKKEGSVENGKKAD